MKIWMFSVALLMSLTVGCSTSQTVTQQPPVPKQSVAEYKIGVGDSLSVQVWKSPELSVNVPVRPDGKISVPLIGDVAVAGFTTQAVSDTLSKGFLNYLRNAQVTVILLNPSSGEYLNRVRVTGAVNRPLSLPHRQGMTVLDLVLEAGGTNIYARGNRAQLFRKVNGKVEVFPINLDDILLKGVVETNYTLAPSDIITVPERTF